MTTQPTPGPWKVSEGDSSYVVNQEGVAVAEVTNPAFDRATEAANARLIAAAPRMLELVRALAHASHTPGASDLTITFDRHTVMEQARQLLRDLHGEG